MICSKVEKRGNTVLSHPHVWENTAHTHLEEEVTTQSAERMRVLARHTRGSGLACLLAPSPRQPGVGLEGSRISPGHLDVI